jgi:hypothetical protein
MDAIWGTHVSKTPLSEFEKFRSSITSELATFEGYRRSDAMHVAAELVRLSMAVDILSERLTQIEVTIPVAEPPTTRRKRNTVTQIEATIPAAESPMRKRNGQWIEVKPQRAQ